MSTTMVLEMTTLIAIAIDAMMGLSFLLCPVLVCCECGGAFTVFVLRFTCGSLGRMVDDWTAFAFRVVFAFRVKPRVTPRQELRTSVFELLGSGHLLEAPVLVL